MAELGAHAQSLEKLRLDNLKHLTDEGLSYLAGCRSLRRISITNCPSVTVAGTVKLQSALPLVRITHDQASAAR
jgi:hypothetical protein